MKLPKSKSPFRRPLAFAVLGERFKSLYSTSSIPVQMACNCGRLYPYKSGSIA